MTHEHEPDYLPGEPPPGKGVIACVMIAVAVWVCIALIVII